MVIAILFLTFVCSEVQYSYMENTYQGLYKPSNKQEGLREYQILETLLLHSISVRYFKLKKFKLKNSS